MARLTPAVLRTLDILELFLSNDVPLSASDVVRMTGYPKTSVHELLSTLAARNYLHKDEASGTFRLGVRLLQLGNAYSARFDMLKSANDVARELAARSGETVSVATLEGADIFYLAKVESRDNLRLPSSIGQRLPANVTGLGKALLAYVSPQHRAQLFPDPNNLPALTERSIKTLGDLENELEHVLKRGIAFENQESTPNVKCAAAPVRGVSGAVVAAISISVASPRWEQLPERHWVELVKQGAAELSALLGYKDPAAELSAS
jgi:IclR family KDG regulon transcriptional repressor